MSVIRRDDVNTGLKNMLAHATGFPVGISRAPETAEGEPETYPLIVVIPRPRGRLRGPMYENSWADADLEYIVKSVGKREDQVERCADRVRAAILDKDPNNEYTFEIDVGPGQELMDRRPGDYSPGSLIPNGTIFEVDDTFVFAITTS